MKGAISLRVLARLLFMCSLSDVAHAQVVEYVHTDALGSVVAISDSVGQVTERREYEPFGSQLTPAIQNGPGFTGHVQDAITGLTYMQQRYYDPQLGRFLSVDPVLPSSVDGRNFNRFKYAANNPYRFTDPDGRVDWDMLGDSFKLEGAVGLGLEAKIKIGPVKGYLGAGGAMFGGGVTLAPDAYGFQEVTGPSAGLEVGRYGVGLRGSSERSYQGRHGQIYSEESSKGGGMFGLKRGELAIENGGTNAELSGSASLFLAKLTGSIDLGKAFNALKAPNPNSSNKRAGGFQGVFRVQGRIDSNRLDKELRGK